MHHTFDPINAVENEIRKKEEKKKEKLILCSTINFSNFNLTIDRSIAVYVRYYYFNVKIRFEIKYFVSNFLLTTVPTSSLVPCFFSFFFLPSFLNIVRLDTNFKRECPISLDI